MKIPVRNLSPEGRELDEEVTLADLELEGSEWESQGNLIVQGKVSRNQEEVHAQGTIRGGLYVECDRCAERYVHPFAGTFDLYYHQIESVPGGEDELPESTDPSMVYFAGHHVDLTEPLRDAVVLSLPSRHLCREDCQGLCPRCGANRNEEPCGCAPVVEEPTPAANPFQQFFQSRGRRE